MGIESRLLPGLQKDQLAESADEMKDLLQVILFFFFVITRKPRVE